ncbi:MAG: prepilin-type N-terminal cleavage/methylation domain-containing protein [Candidatus Pacebacteria bacterium]|nr:prepilin-type N-terminal cleavage/methylation domain-containing protein [Candidatus Paceibacterota bacterium]
MFKFLKQKNNSSGFTLVETLVAIAIFTTSVVAMMVILGDSLSNLTYAKRKLTATYLAQEGVEYMRNLRDTYVLYSAPGETTNDAWNDFKANVISKCGSIGCTFNIDDLPSSAFIYPSDQPIIDIVLTTCTLANNNVPCPYLYYDINTGEYNYVEIPSNTHSNSGFRRRIRVEADNVAYPNVDEIRVISTVFWIQGSGIYETSFSESLFNWTKQ